MQVEIDKLALEPMRGLASAEAGDAFLKYLRAIDKAAKELKATEDLAAKKDQLAFEIAVSIGIVVATPLTAGAAAAIAGAALTAPLTRNLARELPEILKRAGVPLQTGINTSAAVSESIARLASKFSGSDSQKILGEATKSLSKVISVAAHKDRFACGRAFLGAMESAVESAKGALNPLIGKASFDQLLGVYNACKSNTTNSYYAIVSKQLSNFMDQMADVMVNKAKSQANESTTKDTIVKLNAFGRIRYARVLMNLPSGENFSTRTTYTFKAWVARELEEMAEKLGPRLINPNEIVGRLPDPGPDPPPEVPPPINVKDLPDAPINVKDLPDAPSINVRDLPDAPKR